MPAHNFKILQKLEDRLLEVAESVGPCRATLYGTEYEGSLLVVGLSVDNSDKTTAEHNNPFGVNLVGVADIGSLRTDEELNAVLANVQGTKYPVVLTVSTAGTVKSRSSIDGQLVASSFEAVEEDEFLSNFMFLNFVMAAPEETKEDGEDGEEKKLKTSSRLDEIKPKLEKDPPVFRTQGTPEPIASSHVEPFELFQEVQHEIQTDPRLPSQANILTIEVLITGDSAYLRTAPDREVTLTNVNTICLIPKDRSIDLNELFLGSVLRSLKSFQVELANDGCEQECYSSHIFFPREVGYLVSAIYPVNGSSELLLKNRLSLHEAFGLSTAAPRFTLSLALSHFFGISPAVSYSGEKHLLNVHESVKPPKMRDAQVVTVRGLYSYFHYLQDGEKDEGWGCAYRSFQAIFSWYLWQGFVAGVVPSIRNVQEILVRIKDKPESFIGSKQWIGSQELCYVLDETVGATCRIIHVPTGKGMLDERYSLQAHFEEQGTPVMVGGGQYAYTILGITCGDSPSDTRFLILDPHYVGPHDLKTILKKSGVSWKAVDMFKTGQFYNLCLPLASSSF